MNICCAAGKRPLNSALEVDLDFERAIRPPPQPTQEALEALEDMIRRRIADHQYDDPPRIVAPEPVKAKHQLELNDARSAKVRLSLAGLLSGTSGALKTSGVARHLTTIKAN